MKWLERIFATHQRCKEITRLSKGGNPVTRALAGFWAGTTGRRIALGYKLFRPALPEPLSGEGEVVVSIASFPARISRIWMVIDVVMRMNPRPAEIYLCLCEEEFSGHILPDSLKPYLERGLKVIWSSYDIKPHNKYQWVFRQERAGKRRLVVTLDDDLFYAPDCIERLLALHSRFPGSVCANLARRINDGLYSQWPFVTHPDGPSEDLLALGFGGVLYPPSVYDRDCFFDLDRIMRVAVMADDLWLRHCESKEGIGVVTGEFFALPPGVPSTQKISLQSENVGRGRNDKIWEALRLRV